MLPEYTHNIINLNETEKLVTVIWANEILDSSHQDTDMQQNETMPAQREQDMQAVDSTESPISSYDEKLFEDEIKSPVWEQMPYSGFFQNVSDG